MTNYNELAKRIISHTARDLTDGIYPSDSRAFCHDGRVVLLLITMLRKRGFSFLLNTYPDGHALVTVQAPMDFSTATSREHWAAQVVNEQDAIAICEACCDALDGAKSKRAYDKMQAQAEYIVAKLDQEQASEQ